jgi:hypothetical protein
MTGVSDRIGVFGEMTGRSTVPGSGFGGGFGFFFFVNFGGGFGFFFFVNFIFGICFILGFVFPNCTIAISPYFWRVCLSLEIVPFDFELFGRHWPCSCLL